MNGKHTIYLRQEYNRRILKVLKEEIEKYPNLRFTQLLYNLDIEDTNKTYNEESVDTYNKIVGGITKRYTYTKDIDTLMDSIDKTID